MRSYPTCYLLPTQTVLLDDDADLLASLELKLNNQGILTQSFEDPTQMLAFLDEQYEKKDWFDSCISKESNNELDSNAPCSVIHIEKIHEAFLSNPNRFSEISILVIDHVMAKMQGLDVCIELQKRDHRFKIIMLTGIASSEMGIHALNQGIIHVFLSKGKNVSLDALTENIFLLRKKYFALNSSYLFKNFFSDDHVLFTPSFQTLLHKICEAHAIVEYYLLDENGSFLLLNASGKLHWLIVQSKENIQHSRSLATFHDFEKVIQKLSDNKNIFYVYPHEKWPEEEKDWLQHLFPAQPIDETNKQHFYTLVTENPLLDSAIPFEIIPFASYKNK